MDPLAVFSCSHFFASPPPSERLEQASFEGVGRGAFVDDGTGRRPMWRGDGYS